MSKFSTQTFSNRLKRSIKQLVLILALGLFVSDANAQFCTSDLTNGIDTTKLTATSENFPNEGRTKAVDNLLTTKWSSTNVTPSLTINFTTPKIITYYSITSGNVLGSRDPRDWVIEGSNDGTTFTMLDTKTAQTFASRIQTRYFSFANTNAYQYYRFRVTANNGSATLFEVQEMQFLSNSDCVTGNVYKTNAGTPYPNVPVYIRNYTGTVATTNTDVNGAFKFSVTDIPTVVPTTLSSDLYKSVYTVLVQPPANTYFYQGPPVNFNNAGMTAFMRVRMPLQTWANGAYMNAYGNIITPSGRSLLIDNNQGSLTPSSLDWVLRPTTSNAPVCTLIPTTLDGNGTFGNLAAADFLTQHPWQTSFHRTSPTSPQEAHPLLFKPLSTALTAYGVVDSLDLSNASFLKTVLIDETRYVVTSYLGTQSDGIAFGNAGFDNASYNLLNGFAGGWRKTYGHTTGDAYDQFIAVNGSPTGASPLLEFTADINFAGNYYVNFYGKNANSFVQNINTPVELILKVYDPSNNLVATTNLTLPRVTQASDDLPTAPWTPQSALFAVNTLGTYTFRFDVPTTSVYGNDFYLDDLTISGCPFYSISGNVFNDVNALTDNTVNGTGTNVSNSMYAALVDEVTNKVIAYVPVSSTGAYSFGGLAEGDYGVVITNVLPVIGATTPSSSLPTGWINTGEHIGTSAGNDGTVNGYTSVQLLGADVTNVNFGIQQPPTAVTNIVPSQVNPGGTTSVVVPSSYFDGNDLNGGTVVSMKITSFPTNATTITINGITYTSATFPAGGVTIPTNINGNPTQTISIDPIDGAVTSVITYTVTDNGGAVSSPATVSVPFTTVTVSGNVFNDPNGGNVDNSTGTTNEVPSGLYANLVDAGGNVVATTTVNTDGIYSFGGVNGGSYTVVLSTTQGTVGSSAPAASTPTGWVNTGEFNGTPGTGNTAPINGVSATFTVSTSNVSDINFGIEQPPVADVKAQQVPYPSGGSIPAGAVTQTISGTDPVLGGTAITMNSSNTIVITSAPANATMLYDFDGAGGNPPTVVTAGTTITGFDPANLSYTGITSGSVSVVFNYAFVDAAGVTGSSASYTVTWIGGPLPVKLVSFTGKGLGCNTTELRWSVADADNFSGFVVERREGTTGFKGVSVLNYTAGQSMYTLKDALTGDGIYQYRLKLMDVDGRYEYSPVITVAMNCGNKGVRMYPTATRTSTKIYGLTANQQIQIVSSTGQLMETKRVKNSVEEVDLSNYPSGLFFIIIREESNSQVFYGKLIKL